MFNGKIGAEIKRLMQEFKEITKQQDQNVNNVIEKCKWKCLQQHEDGLRNQKCKEEHRERIIHYKQEYEDLRAEKLELQNQYALMKATEAKNKKLAKSYANIQKLEKSHLHHKEEWTKFFTKTQLETKNTHTFLQYYSMDIGVSAEDGEDNSETVVIHFEKIHPIDIERKYYIYFSALNLRKLEFVVHKVAPEFEEFEALKIEMNKSQKLVELMDRCREYWKRDASLDITS